LKKRPDPFPIPLRFEWLAALERTPARHACCNPDKSASAKGRERASDRMKHEERMKLRKKKLSRSKLGIAAGAALSFAVTGAHAADPATAANAGEDTGRIHASEMKPVPSEPDNSGRNVRDEDGKTLTPMDQSNDPADLDLTQKIRQGITSNDAMSIQAQNIKIITQGGVVTLRGPVKTMDEKTTIEAVATSAGAKRIDNQLEIDHDDDTSGKENQ
jgi:hypothetical protein